MFQNLPDFAESNSLNTPTMVPALEKAISILEFLSTQEQGLNLTDISNSLRLPKSTVFRILVTLKHFGYVEQEGEKGVFTLGPRVLSLAHRVKDKFNLTRLSLPFMEQLTKETTETSKLGVLRNDELIVVCRVQSTKEMSITTEVGRTFPLHAGAASKLLLAHLPEIEINRIIDKGLKKYTPSTITNPDKLREELQAIVRQGFSEDNEEFFEGLKAIACPVFDYQGRVVAALSIPFLATRGNGDKQKELLVRLFSCARGISEALGHGK